MIRFQKLAKIISTQFIFTIFCCSTANIVVAQETSPSSNTSSATTSNMISAPDPRVCNVTLQGVSAQWIGYDIFSDRPEFELDFSKTGINLNNIRIDPGSNFMVTKISNEKLRLDKPSWVTGTVPGYLGLNADNYPAFLDAIIPICN